MRTSLGVLVTVLAFASRASAYSAFAGCIIPSGIPTGFVGATMSGTSIVDPTGVGCASFCSNQLNSDDYGYSAWNADQANCDCLTLGRAGQQDITAATGWRYSTSSSATCATSDSIVWRLDSAWQNSNTLCYSAYTAVAPLTALLPAADLSECFERCVTYTMMQFLPTSTDGIFQCQCDSGITTETPTTCGPNTFFAYGRTAAAAASGVYRRSLREAAKREAARKQAKFPFCPDRSQACKITGSAEGYECVETRFELESCGGCVEGIFGATGNSTATGVDCSQVAGVPMGAISCLLGKCVAYACEEGWTLKGGLCTRA